MSKTVKLIKADQLEATFNAAENAQSKATQALNNANTVVADGSALVGVDPNYISYDVDVLPSGAGAVAGTIGAYFTPTGLQKIKSDGSGWNPVGEEIITKGWSPTSNVNTSTDVQAVNSTTDNRRTLKTTGFAKLNDGGEATYYGVDFEVQASGTATVGASRTLNLQTALTDDYPVGTVFEFANANSSTLTLTDPASAGDTSIVGTVAGGDIANENKAGLKPTPVNILYSSEGASSAFRWKKIQKLEEKVTNVEALKNLIIPVENGTKVDVLGYYEDGDGGGGLFYAMNYQAKVTADRTTLNTTIPVEPIPEALKSGQVLVFTNSATFTLNADATKGATSLSGTLSADITSGLEAGLKANGGAIVERVGGGTFRWKRSHKNTWDVKEFGCKVDGVTNDADKFQLLLDYLELFGGGNIVVQASNSGIMLQSSIAAKSNISMDFCNNNVKTIPGGSYDSSGALIMLGYLSTETTSSAILSENIHLTRVHTDSPDVSRPFYMSNCKNSSITYSSVKNNSNAFFDRRSSNNSFAFNYAENLGFQMIAGGGNESDADIGDGLRVVFNRCKNIGARMVDVRNATNCIVQGNFAEDAAGLFKCQGKGSGLINGNVGTFTDDGDQYDTIQVNSNNFIITNNYLERLDNREHIGIFGTASDIIIKGNHLISNPSAGRLSFGIIRFQNGWNGENIQIEGNNLRAHISGVSVIYSVSESNPRGGVIINDNIITQEPDSDGSTVERITIVLRDMQKVSIKNNQIMASRVTGVSQKGIDIIGCEDVQIEGNNITGLTVPVRGIDLRTGVNTDIRILSNVIDASFEPISYPASGNILRGFNTLNGTHETIASVIA